MLFHVRDRITGEVLTAKGFWAITESGAIVDVIDGWGCEGGGGSDGAPSNAIAVFGPEPVPEPVAKTKARPYNCPGCNKTFATYEGRATHMASKGH